MNRQTTYFLQRVLSGLATSVIYAAFDSYRYNSSQRQYKKRREYNNKKQYYAQPKRRTKEIEIIETNYDRRSRYK